MPLHSHSIRGFKSLLELKHHLSPHNILLVSLHNLQPFPFALAPSTSTQHKISARSSQIARHFSSSSSLSNPNAAPSRTADMAYSVRKIGAANTLEYRIYIEKDGVPISAFHDIPLYANEQQTILNMVVEIPRWTNGKLEVYGKYILNLPLTLPHATPPHTSANSFAPLQISKEDILNPIRTLSLAFRSSIY